MKLDFLIKYTSLETPGTYRHLVISERRLGAQLLCPEDAPEGLGPQVPGSLPDQLATLSPAPTPAQPTPLTPQDGGA